MTSAPTICAPSSSPVSASNTVLTIPSGSPSAIALPLPIKGKCPTLTLRRLPLPWLLGQPDAGHLRPAIGAAGDVAHVERMHVLHPGDLLDADDALMHRLVRQPGRADDIADRLDAVLAGPQPLVDDDMACGRP